MDRVLHLGPLVLPWMLLVLLGAWQLGTMVHERLAARRGLTGGPHGWRLPLIALIAARLGFVLRYADLYASAPVAVLDIRDGGWSPWAGLGAALLYVALLWLRRSPWRQSATAGLATFAGVWLLGWGVLQVTAPREQAALPSWQGVALDARTVALPELKGQPVVVNLWASWCPPCRREMPVMLEAREAQSPLSPQSQVRFLWVNQGEPPETVARFAAQQRLPAADVLLDSAGRLGSALGHKALPTTLFYDRQGRLAAVRVGELSAATLAQHLALISGHSAP